jgi:hypothetical protein
MAHLDRARVYIFALAGLTGLQACSAAPEHAAPGEEDVGEIQEGYHEASCAGVTGTSITLNPHPGDCSVYQTTLSVGSSHGSPGCPDQHVARYTNVNLEWVIPGVTWSSSPPANQLACELSGIKTTLLTKDKIFGLWGVQRRVEYRGKWLGSVCGLELSPYSPDPGYTWIAENSYADIKLAAGAYQVTGPSPNDWVKIPFRHFVQWKECP